MKSLLEVKYSNSNELVSKSGVIESSRTPDSIMNDVEKSIGPLLLSRLPNKPRFIGSKKDWKFFLMRNGSIRNDFRRLLHVTVVPNNDGCELHYEFKHHIGTKIFGFLWLSGVAIGFFAFIGAFIQSVSAGQADAQILIGAIMTVVMFAIGFMLIKYGYVFTVHQERECLDFLYYLAESGDLS